MKTPAFRRQILTLFVFGIGLRAMQAVLRLDMVYPDEQFQVLEPAQWMMGSAAWLTSEWKIGMRSWALPALYVPGIWMFKFLGITSGSSIIQFCRLVTVAVMAVGSWRFLRLLKERGFRGESILLTIGLYWLLPSMIVWESTTFSETASLAAVWISLPWIVRSLEDESETISVGRGIAIGALCALSWLFRYPMGVWTLGLIGTWIYLYRPSRKQVGWVCLGACLPIVFAGLLDWVTWGRPFHSLIAYVRTNFFEGVAAGHGVSPWFTYLGLLAANPGILVCGLTLGLAILAVHLRALALSRRDRLVLCPALFYLIVHSLIGHKETRFLLPVFPALFYFLALAMDAVMGRMPDLAADVTRVLRKKILVFVLAASLSPMIWKAIPSPARFDESDMSDLSVLANERLRATSSGSARCLLIVESSFVWTRGLLLFGEQVHVLETTFSQIRERLSQDPLAFKNCHYALVARGGGPLFNTTLGGGWKLLAKNRNGHTLYAREAP